MAYEEYEVEYRECELTEEEEKEYEEEREYDDPYIQWVVANCPAVYYEIK